MIGLNLYFLFVIYDPAIGIGYIFLAMLIANSLYVVFLPENIYTVEAGIRQGNNFLNVELFFPDRANRFAGNY
ncbi:MAG: hypothetical protein WDO15_15990 [Bacteroidota bacterium]